MKTLYFDCFAGASGDMILGGLAALGLDEEKLRGELAKLSLKGWNIAFEKADRSGISATRAIVSIPEEKKHRHLHHIEEIILKSGLGETIKKNISAVFRRLAEAETKVHGTGLEKVHFHEVGAMDAVIDIAGACIGFEMLGIEKFACSKIHVGSGFIKMAHGNFPVPPPAVVELLKGFQVYSGEIEGELCTPTGAAIISTFCTESGGIPGFEIEKTGYGAGGREYKDFPNALRLMLGKTAGSLHHNETLILLETNIDDISPQILGYVMDKAFGMGVLDCWFTPIQMKKNRPAQMISILCKKMDREKFLELLYRETSTIGVRIREIERNCLERDIKLVGTKFGEVEVKRAKFKGKTINAKPEFDQMRLIAEREGLPLKEVERKVWKKIEND